MIPIRNDFNAAVKCRLILELFDLMRNSMFTIDIKQNSNFYHINNFFTSI